MDRTRDHRTRAQGLGPKRSGRSKGPEARGQGPEQLDRAQGPRDQGPGPRDLQGQGPGTIGPGPGLYHWTMGRLGTPSAPWRPIGLHGGGPWAPRETRKTRHCFQPIFLSSECGLPTFTAPQCSSKGTSGVPIFISWPLFLLVKGSRSAWQGSAGRHCHPFRFASNNAAREVCVCVCVRVCVSCVSLSLSLIVCVRACNCDCKFG